MKLRRLVKGLKINHLYGSLDLEVKKISINSKDIAPGSLFIAVVGFRNDGHNFAVEAVKKGAIVVVVQRKLNLPSNVTQIVVGNCREALPIICRNFFKCPTNFFKLIGVTGTNGKTTTCFLINSILRSAGLKTSVITTVNSFIDDKLVSFDMTTPESLDLNCFFLESKASNIDVACMEVSSHSIDLHRIDYLNFDYFVFTNLSQDHLDYHKSIGRYFEVKKRLFSKEYRSIYGGRTAVVNIDDSYGLKVAKVTDLKTILYSLNVSSTDVFASNIESSILGIRMDVVLSGKESFKVLSPLCGYFNVYNILAAIGVCVDMGISIEHIQEGIRIMKGVKGRFERVQLGKKKKAMAVIDYAHTPDGLENVLKTLRSMLKSGGRLIAVFGCGGDRDKKKREIMGRISANYADFTVITSDNPRSEPPSSIMAMIERGLNKAGSKNFIKEVDREKAIIYALEMAEENDIILIAGKGHENYQEFSDCRIPFSDQEVVKNWVGRK